MLEVSDLSKSYGTGAGAVTAICDLTLTVQEKEFVCIVGPSGCGKTTLLKCVSGLMPATTGEVRLGGQDITGPPEGMAIVFQDYSRSLLPWMTVRQNVEFPLFYRGLSRSQRMELVGRALAAVGLSDFIDQHPWQLSGGMQQRVAIARALAYQPQILLMDEPFASVDAQTRADLEDLLLEVWERFSITVLFVTHDIDEAVYLANRVVALGPSPGRVAAAFEVDLPRPRDQIKTKALERFAHLRAQIFSTIRRKESDPESTDRCGAVPVA